MLTTPQLRKAPPKLDANYIEMEINQGGTYALTAGQDYLIRLNPRGLNGQPSGRISGAWGLKLEGGKNIVIIGGEVEIGADITWTPNSAGEHGKLRGMLLRDQTGTVHVEGLLFTGAQLSEGIQLYCPEATVHLQNIWMDPLDDFFNRGGAGSGTGDDANRFHSDLIQTTGGVGELHVDRFYGVSAYQGALFKVESSNGNPVGPVTMTRTHMVGTETDSTKHGLSQHTPQIPLNLEHVYVEMGRISSTEGKGKWVFPQTDTPGRAATITDDVVSWPSATNITGSVTLKAPEVPVVNRFNVGRGYQSPGYQTDTTATSARVETTMVALNQSRVVTNSIHQLAGGDVHRVPLDFTGFRQIRLRLIVTTASTSSTAEIGLSGAADYTTLSTPANTTPLAFVNAGTAGAKDTGWVNIPRNLRINVWAILAGRTGDGSTVSTTPWYLSMR